MLEKLASMIPKPRINLLIYHGVFAPHARGRGDAVRQAQEGEGLSALVQNPTTGAGVASSGAVPSSPPASSVGEAGPSDAAPRSPPGYRRPTYFTWADLLRRTFAIDVLACPDCGGRLRLLATIADRKVIEKILRHLELPVELPMPAPARQPKWWSGFSSVDVPADSASEWPG